MPDKLGFKSKKVNKNFFFVLGKSLGNKKKQIGLLT